MVSNVRCLLLESLLALALGGMSGCVERVIFASSDTSEETGFPDTGDEAATTSMMPAVDSSAGSGPGPIADSSSSSDDVVSHDEVIQPIWDTTCSLPGCHSAGNVHPDLSPGSSYEAIVGGMSNQVSMPLVTPFDPRLSYLWRKLDGSYVDLAEAQGTMMPLVGMLSSDDLATILTWIEAGASP